MTTLALTIAGSDPSGGAGIQADLKTFAAHGVYGMAVVTLLTAQSTRGVRRVAHVAPDLLDAQLEVLLEDLTPHAIKTGALGTALAVRVVASRLSRCRVPLVIDPVLVSKNGTVLLDDEGRRALVTELLPLCALLTPNLDEAALLLGRTRLEAADIGAAAGALCELGARAVLIKGGHRSGEPVDVLCADGVLHELHARRVDTPHTHGVGCTLSAAITARLAAGVELVAACSEAKAWLTRALASAPALGHGQGPVNHFEPLELRVTADGANAPLPPR